MRPSGIWAAAAVMLAGAAHSEVILRANALENNVVLCKVENGIRVAIAAKGLPSRSYGVKHPYQGGDGMCYGYCSGTACSLSF